MGLNCGRTHHKIACLEESWPHKHDKLIPF
jgi:hypothetical protein